MNIHNSNEEDRIYISNFKFWAEANTYVYKLMMGDLSILPAYVDFIEINESDVLPAMTNILKVANKFDQDINEILHKFNVQIYSEIDQLKGYTDQVKSDIYITFLFGQSVYYLNRGQYPEGMNQLLYCLKEAVKINSHKETIHCVALYERYRHISTPDHAQQYKMIMMEVERNYDKKENRLFHLA